MTIKQLSILIENRSGSLARVLATLQESGVNIIVSTLGDTDGFGIYRVICSDTERAFRALHEKNISVTISNVYAIRLDADRVGAAAEAMAQITGSGVEVKYMYSFLFGGKGIMVFRTDDAARADAVIMLRHLDCLSETELRTP